MILNIYEDILERRGGNVSQWRPRIEHAQIFAPEDLIRIGKLGGEAVNLSKTSRCLTCYFWQSLQAYNRPMRKNLAAAVLMRLRI